MSLEAISYERGRLRLLEQRKLPLESVFVDIPGPKQCHKAIYEMTVRGAPAIAISAALSLAVELVNGGSGAQFASTTQAVEHITSQLDYLITRCDGLWPGVLAGMQVDMACTPCALSCSAATPQ